MDLDREFISRDIKLDMDLKHINLNGTLNKEEIKLTIYQNGETLYFPYGSHNIFNGIFMENC